MTERRYDQALPIATVQDALASAGPRPKHTTDDEWLLIAFERRAFDASKDGPEGMKATEHYGVLRYEIIRRLGVR